jgi:hypothetical protein
MTKAVLGGVGHLQLAAALPPNGGSDIHAAPGKTLLLDYRHYYRPPMGVAGHEPP